MEPGSPDEGSVAFDIKPVSNAPSEQWLATYTADGKTAKFRMEFYATRPFGDKDFTFSFGKGRFLAEPGSDASTFLLKLKQALEAKNLPAHVQRVKDLPFECASLGDHQSRSPDGGFRNSH